MARLSGSVVSNVTNVQPFLRSSISATRNKIAAISAPCHSGQTAMPRKCPSAFLTPKPIVPTIFSSSTAYTHISCFLLPHISGTQLYRIYRTSFHRCVHSAILPLTNQVIDFGSPRYSQIDMASNLRLRRQYLHDRRRFG